MSDFTKKSDELHGNFDPGEGSSIKITLERGVKRRFFEEADDQDESELLDNFSDEQDENEAEAEDELAELNQSIASSLNMSDGEGAPSESQGLHTSYILF